MKIGFIGLGAIGLPIARNAAVTFPVKGFDLADSALWGRPPITVAAGIEDIARSVDVILLSLPDANVVGGALDAILATTARQARIVIDLSTIGIQAAKEFSSMLEAGGIAYVDAPVSGGVAGARERRISLMCACPATVFAEVEPVLRAIANSVFHVGAHPGQGQVLKILNNFLSATALAATSEAMLLGMAHGVEMQMICDVVKASSGRNSAIDDKFPNNIVSGKFDSGFRNTLMTKDVGLYLDEVERAGTPADVASLVVDMWRRFTCERPDTDFTAIFEFVRDTEKAVVV